MGEAHDLVIQWAQLLQYDDVKNEAAQARMFKAVEVWEPYTSHQLSQLAYKTADVFARWTVLHYIYEASDSGDATGVHEAASTFVDYADAVRGLGKKELGIKDSRAVTKQFRTTR